jgi:Spy/CpxP family protein refolding chaperone
MQYRGEVAMKRFTIWSSAALLLIVVSIVVAWADGPRRHGWGSSRGWAHHGPLGYIAHELNLSDAQRSQIKTIWIAERPTAASIVQELASESEEMDSTTDPGSLDESKVQAIAARQGETIARLLVEKERLKSKVYATVLNPAQRIKANELQKTWHSRLDRLSADVGGGGL